MFSPNKEMKIDHSPSMFELQTQDSTPPRDDMGDSQDAFGFESEIDPFESYEMVQNNAPSKKKF